MLTIANKGGEGVKKPEKHANVICERPLRVAVSQKKSGTQRF